MNHSLLQHRFGVSPPGDLVRAARQHEFERIVECSNPRSYSYYRKSNVLGAVTCLDIDNTGQFLLGSGSDGSLSVWSFDDKVDEKMYTESDIEEQETYELLNKRVKYAKRSISRDEKDDTGATAAGPGSQQREDATLREVHSFETSRSKYRMYRKSSSKPNDSVSFLERTEDVSTINAHKYSIRSVKWYKKDNGMFFSGSNDCSVKIWDTNLFEPVMEFAMDYKVNQLDCNRDNLVIVATEYDYPRILDLNSMNMGVTTLGNAANTPMKSEILCCKFNPQLDHIVAVGDDDGVIKIWDLRMGNKVYKRIRKAHLKSCNDIAWDETGRQLVSVGLDGKCKKWQPFVSSAGIGTGTPGEPDEYMAIGESDITRNRYKKRTSQRLAWYDKYIIFNGDYNELNIFEAEYGKLWSKVKNPLQRRAGQQETQLSSMALQTCNTNARGLRLILGTSNTLFEYL